MEETGLLIGRPAGTSDEDPIQDQDGAMRAFKSLGLRPNTQALLYVARAITPTSSPIRYDTRFFVANGEGLFGSLQDSGGTFRYRMAPNSRCIQRRRDRRCDKIRAPPSAEALDGATTQTTVFRANDASPSPARCHS